jgi:hypothetical protein
MGGTLLQVLECPKIPLWRKGSQHPSQMVKPINKGVEASCIPGTHPFQSIRMDRRIWSPNLASVKKHEPQAVQVKGRREVGSIGEEGGGGLGQGKGELVFWGSGVDKAISRRLGHC